MLANPKTTFAGLGAALCTVAVAFGWLSAEQAAAIGGVLTALVGFAAKDGRL